MTAPTHALYIINNFDGQHDREWLFAFMADGVFYRDENGKPVLEYEGDEILQSWPLVRTDKPSEPMFYLQDSRDYVGNDMLFWAVYGGYTTDISKSAKYTLAEAQRMHESRETDIPWPCDYIDAKTRPAVDMQYVKRRDVDRCGIQYVEPKREKPERHNCVKCGRFVNVRQYYLGCPSCGASYDG